jgi:hypothetical protein
MKYAQAFMTQVSTGAALLAVVEGLNWIEIGYGLHPMLAGALAAAFVAVPYLTARIIK